MDDLAARQLIDDAIDGFERYDFLDTRTLLSEAIDEIQDQCGLDKSRRPPGVAADDLRASHLYLPTDDSLLNRLYRAHRLANLGDTVIRLDAEDFTRCDSWIDVPRDDRVLLHQLQLPATSKGAKQGMLNSLVPVFRLLLEVIDVSYERDDIDSVLKCVHLMADYGGLLLWERTLGHAGQPDEINRLFRIEPLWNSTGRPCPGRNTLPSVLNTSRNALRNTGAFRKYVGRSITRVSEVLVECGTANLQNNPGSCDRPCGVASMPALPIDLGQRARSFLVFKRSDFVALRHPSPLGHGFQVPDKDELDEAWTATHRTLVSAGHYKQNAPAGAHNYGALGGLSSIVSYWAGLDAVQEPTTILADLRGSAIDLLQFSDN